MQAVANPKSTKHTKILSIREIAWWWLGDSMKDYLQDGEGYVWADLPVIQRGFVWHANKIERLWDSIAKGFPLGSLMLQRQTDSNPNTGRKDGADSSEIVNRFVIRPGEEEQFFLLDGQQRATSIALGFKNVWSAPKAVTDDGWRTLWVDIGRVDLGDDRSFLFRVTSKSHPWGFSRSAGKISEPTRLAADRMRSAHTFFKWAAEQLRGFEESRSHFPENIETLKPYQVPPYLSLPWDCEAPVPLPLLMQVLMEVGSDDINRAKQGLRQRLQGLAIWRIDRAKTEDASINMGLEKMERVDQILGSTDSDTGIVFETLIKGLDSALRVAEIPAPVLDIDKVERKHNPSDSQSENEKDDNDPAFNLFKRINTQGTALTAEDINYSMLKSAWPESVEVIEGLLKDRFLTYPAQLVSILVRLFLTIDSLQTGKINKKTISGALTIAQFRNLFKKDEGKNKSRNSQVLIEYIKHNSEELLDHLWNLLAGEDQKITWALPAVLAAEIVRKNEDLTVILLLWLTYVKDVPDYHCSGNVLRDTLGFVTAIHWFAHNWNACNQILANLLIDILLEPKSEDYNEKLLHFFGSNTYGKLLEGREPEGPAAAALPTPHKLKELLDSRGEVGQDIWSRFFKDENLYGNGMTHFIDQQKGVVRAFKLFENLIKDNRLVFYAQRQCVQSWFSWFDPTKIDRIEDHNVPWDIDHIVPQSWFNNQGNKYGKKAIPIESKIWKDVTGNLRVWPAEANRAKSNNRLLENSLPEYHLHGLDAVIMSSSIPEGSIFKKLADYSYDEFFCDDDKKRKDNINDFIEAARQRTCYIYGCWYDNLSIANFCKANTDD